MVQVSKSIRESHAEISECGLYRWTLERLLVAPQTPSLIELPTSMHRFLKGTLLVIMLNPSTADATVNDATIRTLIRMVRIWGYESFIVLNLYAYRSTDPKVLKKVADPIGPLNDEYIKAYAEVFPDVLVGWGNHAEPKRAAQVISLLRSLDANIYTVGQNANGSPKHPLYTAATTKLTPYL